MSETHKRDWDPRLEADLRDQVSTYDRMREQCPVAYSELLGWSLFRHEDVIRVLNDPETFSNSVSTHLSVPNGMDPPEHTAFRRLIEPYFRSAPMEAFEPMCRAITAGLTRSLLGHDDVEYISDFAQPFNATNSIARRSTRFGDQQTERTF